MLAHKYIIAVFGIHKDLIICYVALDLTDFLSYLKTHVLWVIILSCSKTILFRCIFLLIIL